MANESSPRSNCVKRKLVHCSHFIRKQISNTLLPESGSDTKNLADEYGIWGSTVGDIKKNEGNIHSFRLTMESVAISKKERKVMHLADNDKIDEAVYFLSKRGPKTFPLAAGFFARSCTASCAASQADSEQSFVHIKKRST